jgi:hypothetical protein
MKIISNMQARRLLYFAYALFFVSMLLPTIAVDLGANHNTVQPGYKIFIGGAVGAIGIILEPGGELRNIYLGMYYLATWLANFALLLPLVTFASQYLLRLLAGISVLLAWSVLCGYLFISDSLILELGVGYYLWSASITLVLLFLTANRVESAPG